MSSLPASARYLNKRKHYSQSGHRRLAPRAYCIFISSTCILRFSRLVLRLFASHVRDVIAATIKPISIKPHRSGHLRTLYTLARLIYRTLAGNSMPVAAQPTPSNDVKADTSAFSEAFKERLHEIRRIIEEDRYRKRVLTLCKQSEPKSFEEYSSSGSFRKLEKFESSTYSEVLKAVDSSDSNKPVVMKIMRALSRGVIKKLPSVTTKGCQSYNDILNELVVTQALSRLHEGVTLSGKANGTYKTPSFCLIHEIKVVSGNLERTLSKSQAEARSSSLNSANNLMKAPQDAKAAGNANGAAPPSLTSATNLQKRPPQKQKQQHQQQQTMTNQGSGSSSSRHAVSDNKVEIKDDELKDLSEEDRMLMEALPYEYVVSVMRHDGQPLWWMMTHKKLSASQLTSVLVQVIIGLAIAERVYNYEHRDLHVSNILIKRTSTTHIPFTLNGNKYSIESCGVKATIIDATFSRLTENGKVYYRDLTSTLKAYGSKKTPTKMSLQNSSYRQMVQLTKNQWQNFVPKTNLIWLTYLCETLIKNEVMKANPHLQGEIKKIRDGTLKVNTTLELLELFPFDKEKEKEKKNTTSSKTGLPPLSRTSSARSSVNRSGNNDKASTFSANKNGK